MNKFDIIEPNQFGRKLTIRYKQYEYGNVEGIANWSIANQGCGPTTLATILSSLGYIINPEEIAKFLLLDEYGNQVDFYNDLQNNKKGIRDIGFIYLLNKLIAEKKYEISYEIIKLSYAHPEIKKEIIIDMIKAEYMAMICVGPWNDRYPKTFSNGGHYLAITSVNDSNNEFYVANPNKIGDEQINTTYSYETIVSNMYTNTFDFLMIKNKSLVLKK